MLANAMNQERFKVLFQQYLNDNLPPEDVEELQRTIQDARNDELLDEMLKNSFNEPAFTDVDDEVRKAIFNTVCNNIKQEHDEPENTRERRRIPYRWLAGAAALLFITLSVGWFFLKRNVEKTENTYVAYTIKPGSNKATLTLANGKKLILTDSLEGQLASEAGVKIFKNKKGEIIYTAIASNDKGEQALQYNVLTTKNGEQFQVILPDGTHVWLDAASSLKYPVTFKGDERKVELTGQGYFEVSHNAAKPFIVKTAQTEVQVLGTHFNVSAFDDEQDTKTTLLEGAVRVKSYKSAVLLKPGEQAVLNNGRELIINNDVDINREVAWKNGLFDFKKAGIEEIMVKVSRWYDIDVMYEGSIPKTRLTGKISRDVDIKSLLEILAFEGIKWRIKGNSVIISN